MNPWEQRALFILLFLAVVNCGSTSATSKSTDDEDEDEDDDDNWVTKKNMYHTKDEMGEIWQDYFHQVEDYHEKDFRGTSTNIEDDCKEGYTKPCMFSDTESQSSAALSQRSFIPHHVQQSSSYNHRPLVMDIWIPGKQDVIQRDRRYLDPWLPHDMTEAPKAFQYGPSQVSHPYIGYSLNNDDQVRKRTVNYLNLNSHKSRYPVTSYYTGVSGSYQKNSSPFKGITSGINDFKHDSKRTFRFPISSNLKHIFSTTSSVPTRITVSAPFAPALRRSNLPSSLSHMDLLSRNIKDSDIVRYTHNPASILRPNNLISKKSKHMKSTIRKDDIPGMSHKRTSLVHEKIAMKNWKKFFVKKTHKHKTGSRTGIRKTKISYSRHKKKTKKPKRKEAKMNSKRKSKIPRKKSRKMKAGKRKKRPGKFNVNHNVKYSKQSIRRKPGRQAKHNGDVVKSAHLAKHQSSHKQKSHSYKRTKNIKLSANDRKRFTVPDHPVLDQPIISEESPIISSEEIAKIKNRFGAAFIKTNPNVRNNMPSLRQAYQILAPNHISNPVLVLINQVKKDNSAKNVFTHKESRVVAARDILKHHPVKTKELFFDDEGVLKQFTVPVEEDLVMDENNMMGYSAGPDGAMHSPKYGNRDVKTIDTKHVDENGVSKSLIAVVEKMVDEDADTRSSHIRKQLAKQILSMAAKYKQYLKQARTKELQEDILLAQNPLSERLLVQRQRTVRKIDDALIWMTKNIETLMCNYERLVKDEGMTSKLDTCSDLANLYKGKYVDSRDTVDILTKKLQKLLKDILDDEMILADATVRKDEEHPQDGHHVRYIVDDKVPSNSKQDKIEKEPENKLEQDDSVVQKISNSEASVKEHSPSSNDIKVSEILALPNIANIVNRFVGNRTSTHTEEKTEEKPPVESSNSKNLLGDIASFEAMSDNMSMLSDERNTTMDGIRKETIALKHPHEMISDSNNPVSGMTMLRLDKPTETVDRKVGESSKSSTSTEKLGEIGSLPNDTVSTSYVKPKHDGSKEDSNSKTKDHPLVPFTDSYHHHINLSKLTHGFANLLPDQLVHTMLNAVAQRAHKRKLPGKKSFLNSSANLSTEELQNVVVHLLSYKDLYKNKGHMSQLINDMKILVGRTIGNKSSNPGTAARGNARNLTNILDNVLPEVKEVEGKVNESTTNKTDNNTDQVLGELVKNATSPSGNITNSSDVAGALNPEKFTTQKTISVSKSPLIMINGNNIEVVNENDNSNHNDVKNSSIPDSNNSTSNIVSVEMMSNDSLPVELNSTKPLNETAQVANNTSIVSSDEPVKLQPLNKLEESTPQNATSSATATEIDDHLKVDAGKAIEDITRLLSSKGLDIQSNANKLRQDLISLLQDKDAEMQQTTTTTNEVKVTQEKHGGRDHDEESYASIGVPFLRNQTISSTFTRDISKLFKQVNHPDVRRVSKDVTSFLLDTDNINEVKPNAKKINSFFPMKVAGDPNLGNRHDTSSTTSIQIKSDTPGHFQSEKNANVSPESTKQSMIRTLSNDVPLLPPLDKRNMAVLAGAMATMLNTTSRSANELPELLPDNNNMPQLVNAMATLEPDKSTEQKKPVDIPQLIPDKDKNASPSNEISALLPDKNSPKASLPTLMPDRPASSTTSDTILTPDQSSSKVADKNNEVPSLLPDKNITQVVVPLLLPEKGANLGEGLNGIPILLPTKGNITQVSNDLPTLVPDKENVVHLSSDIVNLMPDKNYTGIKVPVLLPEGMMGKDTKILPILLPNKNSVPNNSSEELPLVPDVGNRTHLSNEVTALLPDKNSSHLTVPIMYPDQDNSTKSNSKVIQSSIEKAANSNKDDATKGSMRNGTVALQTSPGNITVISADGSLTYSDKHAIFTNDISVEQNTETGGDAKNTIEDRLKNITNLFLDKPTQDLNELSNSIAKSLDDTNKMVNSNVKNESEKPTSIGKSGELRKNDQASNSTNRTMDKEKSNKTSKNEFDTESTPMNSKAASLNKTLQTFDIADRTMDEQKSNKTSRDEPEPEPAAMNSKIASLNRTLQAKLQEASKENTDLLKDLVTLSKNKSEPLLNNSNNDSISKDNVILGIGNLSVGDIKVGDVSIGNTNSKDSASLGSKSTKVTNQDRRRQVDEDAYSDIEETGIPVHLIEQGRIYNYKGRHYSEENNKKRVEVSTSIQKDNNRKKRNYSQTFSFDKPVQANGTKRDLSPESSSSVTINRNKKAVGNGFKVHDITDLILNAVRDESSDKKITSSEKSRHQDQDEDHRRNAKFAPLYSKHRNAVLSREQEQLGTENIRSLQNPNYDHREREITNDPTKSSEIRKSHQNDHENSMANPTPKLSTFSNASRPLVMNSTDRNKNKDFGSVDKPLLNNQSTNESNSLAGILTNGDIRQRIVAKITEIIPESVISDDKKRKLVEKIGEILPDTALPSSEETKIISNRRANESATILENGPTDEKKKIHDNETALLDSLMMRKDKKPVAEKNDTALPDVIVTKELLGNSSILPSIVTKNETIILASNKNDTKASPATVITDPVSEKPQEMIDPGLSGSTKSGKQSNDHDNVSLTFASADGKTITFADSANVSPKKVDDRKNNVNRNDYNGPTSQEHDTTINKSSTDAVKVDANKTDGANSSTVLKQMSDNISSKSGGEEQLRKDVHARLMSFKKMIDENLESLDGLEKKNVQHDNKTSQNDDSKGNGTMNYVLHNDTVVDEMLKIGLRNITMKNGSDSFSPLPLNNPSPDLENMKKSVDSTNNVSQNISGSFEFNPQQNKNNSLNTKLPTEKVNVENKSNSDLVDQVNKLTQLIESMAAMPPPSSTNAVKNPLLTKELPKTTKDEVSIIKNISTIIAEDPLTGGTGNELLNKTTVTIANNITAPIPDESEKETAKSVAGQGKLNDVDIFKPLKHHHLKGKPANKSEKIHAAKLSNNATVLDTKWKNIRNNLKNLKININSGDSKQSDALSDYFGKLQTGLNAELNDIRPETNGQIRRKKINKTLAVIAEMEGEIDHLIRKYKQNEGFLKLNDDEVKKIGKLRKSKNSTAPSVKDHRKLNFDRFKEQVATAVKFLTKKKNKKVGKEENSEDLQEKEEEYKDKLGAFQKLASGLKDIEYTINPDTKEATVVRPATEKKIENEIISLSDSLSGPQEFDRLKMMGGSRGEGRPPESEEYDNDNYGMDTLGHYQVTTPVLQNSLSQPELVNITNSVNAGDKIGQIRQANVVDNIQRDEMRGVLSDLRVETENGLKTVFKAAAKKQNKFIDNMEDMETPVPMVPIGGKGHMIHRPGDNRTLDDYSPAAPVGEDDDDDEQEEEEEEREDPRDEYKDERDDGGRTNTGREEERGFNIPSLGDKRMSVRRTENGKKLESLYDVSRFANKGVDYILR